MTLEPAGGLAPEPPWPQTDGVARLPPLGPAPAPRRVLVTGGAGFIGSHTVDLLLGRGYAVRVLDALCPPVHAPGTFPPYLSRDVEFVYGEVSNPDALRRALDGVQAVLHLAAYQDYLPAFSRFAIANEVGTALLYELLVQDRLCVDKVVVASSQAVYGEGRYRCPHDGVQHPPPRPPAQLARGEWDVVCPHCGGPVAAEACDEAVVCPHNQYSVSKYAQELYGLVLGARHGIPTTALRYSITQGPRQSFRNAYSGVLRTFAARLLHGRPPLVYEDGRQLRDYVYVGDVARANLLALEDPRTDGQVYNVGGGDVCSVLDYARLLARVAGREDLAPLLPGAYRVGDTRHVISDSRRLRALGWAPTLGVADIAGRYLTWAAAQPDLLDASETALAEMQAVGTVRVAQPQNAGPPSRPT